MLPLLRKTCITYEKAPGSCNKLLEPSSLQVRAALLVVVAALPRHGSPLGWSFFADPDLALLCSPQGWDLLDYSLGSFSFEGKRVANSSKGLHLSYPK